MNITLFLVCFAAYIGLMVLIGIKTSKNETGEAYLMGSRGLPAFLVIGTMLATQVGTGSSMGAAGFGYTQGWAGLIYGIGGFLGIMCVIWFFGNIREYNFTTMSEEISFYFGANKIIKAVVSVIIFIASVGWLGAHILGGSMYLAWITGLDLSIAKLITILAFGIYVIAGGYMAVVWTDAIQAIILFFGFIIIAVYLIITSGGLGAITAAMPEGTTTFLGIGSYGALPTISLIVSLTIGGLSAPSFRHRIYSSKNQETAKKGFWISAMLYIVFAAFPVIIGMAAHMLNPDLENSNFSIPYLAMNVLPPALGLIIMIAGLSATMSSGDSDAIAGVTILINDIIPAFTKKKVPEEKLVKVSRIATASTLLLAFIMAVTAVDITNYISNMISTTMTGLAVASVFGRHWKRATWQGGIAAMAAGSVCSIVGGKIPAITNLLGDSTLVALAGAVLACVIVSLLTPENKVTEEEALELIKKDRIV